MFRLGMVLDALHWLGLVACVAFAANTIVAESAGWLFDVQPLSADPELTDDPSRGAVGLQDRPDRDLDIANLFCPTCGPQASARPEELTSDVDVDALPLTQLPLRVVATMDLGETPSMATLYDLQQHTVGIYRLGDPIDEVATLAAVGPGHVLIRHDGRLERVSFDAPKTPPTSPHEKPRPAQPPREGKWDDRVKCSDENTCQVDRALVDELFGNPMALAKELRAGPYAPDGELQGFRIYKVQKGSLPAKLGLKRGDTLVELGGQTLSSADQLLTMATKLRHASRVSATIVRGGKRIEKTLEVR